MLDITGCFRISNNCRVANLKLRATSPSVWLVVLIIGLAICCFGSVAFAQGDSNSPPQVSILWPRHGEWWDDSFSVSTLLKIKSVASDPDGSVIQVQFFVDTNLVGVSTNPPFNIIWQAGTGVPINDGFWALKAVAVDNSESKTESIPLRTYYYTGLPPYPVVEMISPRNGELFAAPATFVVTAEVLAVTSGYAGPVEFFVGTNSVGVVDADTPFTATATPSSVTVSDLPEGEYPITFRFHGGDGIRCPCNLITNTIRVVKLGVQSPSVTPGSQLEFEVITAFPDETNLIQASTNLVDWVSMSTNVPASNRFTFAELLEATAARQFYRALGAASTVAILDSESFASRQSVHRHFSLVSVWSPLPNLLDLP